MTATVVGDAGEGGANAATVLHLVRSGSASTRPEVARLSGLGRKAVALRVDQLLDSGLLREGRLGRSTGGRLPRELQFAANRGRLLVAELGPTIRVGLTDLSGRLLDHCDEPADVMAGAEPTLARIEQLFHKLLTTTAAHEIDEPRRTDRGARPLWGIGIGVLGPVDASSGRPVSLPFLRGWGDYPVRDRLEAAFGVPVWVDNEVNLMALGELRSGTNPHPDMIYVKLSGGVAAGIISGGRLNRGAGGAAGEVGHISVTDDPEIVCACGNIGCLREVVGPRRIVAAGTDAARRGLSPALNQILDSNGELEPDDVTRAAALGDKAAIEILSRAADKIGRVLAILVNVQNPSLILIGGSVATAGDFFLSAVRHALYQRAFPPSVRDLRISFSSLGDRACLIGAAHLALDTLMSHDALPAWIDNGSPAGFTATQLSGMK